MITKETADGIARTYREIESGEKLLLEVDKELEKESEKIGFHGEKQQAHRNCQLGWPNGDNGYRIYQVEPKIAKAVIIAHLADQRSKLEKLNEIANLEQFCAKASGIAEPEIIECKKCFCILPSIHKYCPFCGTILKDIK